MLVYPSDYVMKTVILVSIILCSACAGSMRELYPPQADEPVKPIYLVTHGWHTGIVFNLDDIPYDVWPEAHHFTDTKYLEVGWGDKDFYQAPEITLWNKIKAALWPTSGVLHIVGFNDPLHRAFPHSEIIGLELSQSGFEQLCHYIHESYEKDAIGNVVPLGPGLYGDGRFYLSSEKYHLFKTCNVWTAKAIRSAGFPIMPLFSITTESLMSKVREQGNLLQIKQSE